MSETVQVILAISFIILAVGTTVAIILSRRARVKSKFFDVETESSQESELSTMLFDENKKINELYDLITNLRIDIVRLELLGMLHHDRDNTNLILLQYDKYEKLGGNGYIKHLIIVWKKEKGIEE